MQINSYKSLDFIPMFNFYKVEETGDLRYLLKLDDYEQLPEVDTKPLKLIWEQMGYEYKDISTRESRKSEILDDLQREILLLEERYNLIQLCISSLAVEKDDEVVMVLADLKYKINPKRDYSLELNRIKRLSKQLLTSANLKRSELEDMSKATGKKSSIYATIEAVERHRKITIDEKTTPMAKWLVMMYKVIEETSKKAVKNG